MAIDCATYAVTVIFALLSTAFFASAMDGDRKVYIVYMGEHPQGQVLTQEVHTNMLDGILEGSTSRESLVHSYTNCFNGFAAKLTEKEAKKIADLKGIVSVFPSQKLTLHTTNSWDFLQFPKNVIRNPVKESDIIIGVIDTGIDPQSFAFADDGFGPPPAKWKGVCQNMTCNNKLIGARAYSGNSPWDDDGHGTHTASIAAGMHVDSVSLFGLGFGTTRGAVPSARIAVYKVCSPECSEEDTLAAFCDAINDGVDIVTVSLGNPKDMEYFRNSIAIGSFHAMKHGVFTAASAGNNGPHWGTLSNMAPWITVVAASSTTRSIVTDLLIGDSGIVMGYSVNTFGSDTYFPLLYLGDESSLNDCSQANETAKGKIVVCSGVKNYKVPKEHGAEGVVIVTTDKDKETLDTSGQYSYNAVEVTKDQAKEIFYYFESNEDPTAAINKSESFFDDQAPRAAGFSSRGPNILTYNILKPDISAPGIDILAAWLETVPLSKQPDDPRRMAFNMVSGTSMACPHVSGIAAYIKSYHPEWSPAMLMSALITSANPMSSLDGKDEEFAHGAGQLNPLSAVDPGLVYDATVADYVKMLCDSGYEQLYLRMVTGDNSTCPDGEKGDPKDMNYPSMAVHVNPKETFNGITFNRTVTNVGDAQSEYTLKIISDTDLHISVNPEVLKFNNLNEKQTFVVTVNGGPLEENSLLSGSIEWIYEKYNVRSPIVVYTSHDAK